MTETKKNFRTPLLIILGIVAAFALYFTQCKGDGKTPVPTFIVSKDSVTVLPDKSFGADQVKITILNEQGATIVSEIYSVDLPQRFAIPKGSKYLDIKQEYRCKGLFVRCCTSRAKAGPGDGGTPVIATDVPMGRSGTTYTSTTGWCGCNWSAAVGQLPNTPSCATRKEYSIGVSPGSGAGVEKFRIEVTKSNIAGFVPSIFYISIEHPGTVRYYTADNMSAGCTTSLEATANLTTLSCSTVLLCTRTDLRYTCQVQKIMTEVGGISVETDRKILIKCEDGSSSNYYNVNITKPSGACGSTGDPL